MIEIARRINLTFTEEEAWMYDYICSKSSKVGWIKDKLAPEILKEKAMNGSLGTVPAYIVDRYMNT